MKYYYLLIADIDVVFCSAVVAVPLSGVEVEEVTEYTGTETFESLSRVVSTSKLALDWLPKSKQPIRSQFSKLTKLLIVTTTHKFPPQYWQRMELQNNRYGQLVSAEARDGNF